MVYLSPSADVRMLHFAWHHRLLSEDAGTILDFRWANSKLDEENRTLMMDWVIKAAAHDRQPLSYGFDSNGSVFDEQGKLLPLLPGKGLTCATFVLAAHKVHGLELLNPPWSDRASDVAWQEHMIQQLKEHCSATNEFREHIQALEKDVGAVRFRPEEVFAGVISDDAPIAFDPACELAGEIVRELLSAEEA